MCCFSRPIETVYDTKIFARGLAGAPQQLVYSMGLRTPYDVAMILPIPVKRGSGENAVRFISLKKYPDFFGDLEKGFPRPRGQQRLAESDRSATDSKQLDVVKVGNFEASFVPTVKDFSRLDERFRSTPGKNYPVIGTMDLWSSSSRKALKRSTRWLSNSLANIQNGSFFPPFTSTTERSTRKQISTICYFASCRRTMS